jgi:hypothetical protein
VCLPTRQRAQVFRDSYADACIPPLAMFAPFLQALLWGDLLTAVLAATHATPQGKEFETDFVERAILTAYSAFSEFARVGVSDLDAVADRFACDSELPAVDSDASADDAAPGSRRRDAIAAMHASDVRAFHGADAVFSLR